MKRLTSAKSIAALVVAVGAIAASSAAHARDDVSFSIGVRSHGDYVQPAPVYVQPRVVYVPAPVYYGRHDRQHWERRGPYGDRDHDGIANVYDRGNARYLRHPARRYGPYGDLDRDGIPNQYDRDRDGDGIRNRFDRLPDNPYRN